MNLLSLDTSTEFLSLALQAGDKIFTHHQHAGNASSELILPQIQALLDAANMQLKDLHGIAFGAGPGAFTGVRSACGVAQGLGFGANIPVVGVNTLMAVAQGCFTQNNGADKVIVCLDARMGEIYHAAFEKVNNQWQEVSETQLCKPEAAPVLAAGISTINTHEKQWVGAGSGWGVYGDALSKIYQQDLVRTLPNMMPTAEAILQLAKPIFAAGEAKPASEATPIYIRNRVALTTLQREAGQRL